MDNPEKLATLSTQDTRRKQKPHHIMCVRHHYAQTNTNNITKTWPMGKLLSYHAFKSIEMFGIC